MKTALSLLKFIALILALAWLASCSNRKERIIDQIHAYNDIIGLNKVRIHMLQYPIDSLRNAYSSAYPARAYQFTEADMKALKEWRARERVAYHEMLLIEREIEIKNMIKRATYEAIIAHYQKAIDSLKIELYR